MSNDKILFSYGDEVYEINGKGEANLYYDIDRDDVDGMKTIERVRHNMFTRRRVYHSEIHPVDPSDPAVTAAIMRALCHISERLG